MRSALVVFILSAITGLAVVVFAWSYLSQPDSLETKFGVFFVKPVHLGMEFLPTGHACGGPDSSWITGYEASDGERLSIYGATFSSPSGARKKLQKRLDLAIRVIERGPKYDGHGRTVGEQVVAVFQSKEKGKEAVSVMWTNGNRLYSIDAPSISHALEMERKRGY
ncbi:MAG: hypothetical protein AB1631_01470 [Acidobacteriota bacterium]